MPLQEDIFNALGLTGQLLLGQAVMVKSSEVSLLPPVVLPLMYQGWTGALCRTERTAGLWGATPCWLT